MILFSKNLIGLSAFLICMLCVWLIVLAVGLLYKDFVSSQGSTEKGLREMQERCPNNILHITALASLYERRMYLNANNAYQENASKAFMWYERAYDLTSDKQIKISMLQKLALMACNPGSDKAGLYANILLESIDQQPDYAKGSATHYGNLVLGRLALRNNDLMKAKYYLIRSGQILGSPSLNTAGPSMILAKELLEQNEKEAVLQYFGLCANFWKMDRGKLKRWEELVKNNQLPDFGRQLYQ